jgi:hypothetical protein
MSEASEMVAVLCGLFDMVNQRIAKEHRGPGLPDGGWKVLNHVNSDYSKVSVFVVMRRDDGKKFRITVEES